MAAIKYLTVEHLSTKDLIRIFSKISVDPTVSWNGTPCWVWTRACDVNGYGITTLKPHGIVIIKTHRLMYAWLVKPIPIHPKFGIDHLCRNHPCCNPLHLEDVPTRINLLRGNSLQSKNAIKTHCIHGHPLSGDNLYVQITPQGSHRYCRKCAEHRTRAYYERNRELVNRRSVERRQALKLNV